eukprot:SAG11_NODE_2208_length_3685_cov_1.936419_2_plen_115_part_00
MNSVSSQSVEQGLHWQLLTIMDLIGLIPRRAQTHDSHRNHSAGLSGMEGSPVHAVSARAEPRRDEQSREVPAAHVLGSWLGRSGGVLDRGVSVGPLLEQLGHPKHVLQLAAHVR